MILVNPSGIYVGEGASINVGGILASGLSIEPSDFMNGDYAFKPIDGSDRLAEVSDRVYDLSNILI